MQLTREALTEYEALWRKDHPNKEIDRQALINEAERILCTVKAVFKPIPTEDEDEYKALLQN